MFYHSAYWKNCKMLTELTVHHHITHYQVKLWRCVNLSSYNVTHALRNNFELLKPHPDRGSLRLQKFSVTNREPLPLHKLSVTHTVFFHWCLTYYYLPSHVQRPLHSAVQSLVLISCWWLVVDGLKKRGAAPLCYLTSHTPPKNIYTR